MGGNPAPSEGISVGSILSDAPTQFSCEPSRTHRHAWTLPDWWTTWPRSMLDALWVMADEIECCLRASDQMLRARQDDVIAAITSQRDDARTMHTSNTTTRQKYTIHAEATTAHKDIALKLLQPWRRAPRSLTQQVMAPMLWPSVNLLSLLRPPPRNTWPVTAPIVIAVKIVLTNPKLKKL